ncbi:MAG: glycosyltransferase, partial [Myxococcota bacterium]
MYKGTPVITPSMDERGVAGWRAVIDELRTCDILHFHTTPSVGLILLAKLFGAKIVRTVHYVDAPKALASCRGLSQIKNGFTRVRNYFIREVLIDRWVSVSKQCRAYILLRWGAPSLVIYNGVDTDFFQPSAEKYNIRQRLGLGDEKIYVAVGQLIKRKRFVELIEDFKDVPGTLLI